QGLLVGVIAIGRDNTVQKQLTRELRAISNCNQTLMRAVDEQTLLKDICRIICDDAGYDRVWVGYLENREAKTLRPVASAGVEDAFVDNSESDQIPSCIVLPLRDESGVIFGALNIYSATAYVFTEGEVRLLEELAGDLAFGIVVLRARIERDRQQQWLGLLEHVLNHSHEAVYLLTDINAGFIYVNEEACRALNYSREELLKMGIPDIDPDFSLENAPSIWNEMLIKGHVIIESRHRRRDGRIFPVEILCTIVSYQGQKLAIALVRDITERKQAEEKLRISEERLRLTLEAAQIAIFDWNVTEDKFFTSPTYDTMLGYEPETGAGNRDVWLARVHPDDRAHVALTIQQVLAKEFNEYRYEARIMHAEGHYRWIEAKAFSIEYDEFGKVTRILGIRMDITERKHTEEILYDSEERYRMIFQNSPLGIFRSTLEGRFLAVNPALAKMLGFDTPESLITEVNDIGEQIYVHAKDRQFFIARQLDGEENSCFLSRFRRKNGSEFIANLYLKTIRDAEGRAMFLEGIIEDITDRYHVEEQLRIAATAFEAQEGIIITDAGRLILRINQAFTKITGYTPDEVVGRTPNLMSSDRHDGVFYHGILECIADKGAWQGELWSRRKNGEIYPVWLNITAVKNEAGDITHYVGMMVDITARKTAEKEIEQLAFYDPLTHLPNRRLLQDRLYRGLYSCSRNQSRAALLFIDLDNFKILNDTCGHDTGDRLLVMVAERLTACVREGDTISRLGGDEFVIILENLSPCQQESSVQAKKVGEKILWALNQPYKIAGQVYHSTPSIGVTLFAETENSVEELLKQADIAMYEAKSAGRNTLRFFDPDMESALAARAALEAELRQGIKDHRFVLHYQPQADFEGNIISAEALIRWTHPERGIVSSAQFIPLAEETGLILPIGHWVLETACAQLKTWMANPATSLLQLAINVSPLQFRQTDFVDQVRRALKISGAPSSRLKIELTETLVLENVEDTIAKMNELKQMGLSFSMDDFGTGYSSLSYLTRLPLDQLKIDQSFIRNLPDNANDAAVVQTIITLAKSLKLGVIAEGVETEMQRQFLKEHGCPTYQGYLLSKPIALEAFEQLIRK
ncbi:MAG: PAS domain S-box protein, partial [Methylomonas sp.]